MSDLATVNQTIYSEKRSNGRILVIDDNFDAADILQMLLTQRGFEVKAAYSGKSGIALANEFMPNLVICDLGMPLLDGYEVASILRNAPATRHVLLVAVTAWTDEETRRATKAVGFDYQLTKLINAESLNAVLADCFGGLAADLSA